MGKISLFCFFILTGFAFLRAETSSHLNVATQDGTVTNWPYKLKVTNGSLIDNVDGTMSLTTGSGAPVSGSANYWNYPSTGTLVDTYGVATSTLALTMPSGNGSTALSLFQNDPTVGLNITFANTNWANVALRVSGGAAGNIACIGGGVCGSNPRLFKQGTGLNEDIDFFNNGQIGINGGVTPSTVTINGNVSIGNYTSTSNVPAPAYGLLVSGGVQLSSNTILQGATIYQDGRFNIGSSQGLNVTYGIVGGTGTLAQVQITSNTVIQGTTIYQDGTMCVGCNETGTATNYFKAGASNLFVVGRTFTGVGVNIASPGKALDVSGDVRVTGTNGQVLASQFVQNSAATPALALQAAGANFGQVLNKARITWALGYGSSNSTNGTDVLEWDSSPNVQTLSSMTVVNTSATQKWVLTASTSNIGPYAVAVSTTNHLNFQDQQSSPTLTGCGTQPSIIGSDNSFEITPGAAAGGCTATFATPYKTNLPICTVTPQASSLTNTLSYTISLTAVTITEVSLSSKLDVICTGRDP